MPKYNKYEVTMTLKGVKHVARYLAEHGQDAIKFARQDHPLHEVVGAERIFKHDTLRTS